MSGCHWRDVRPDASSRTTPRRFGATESDAIGGSITTHGDSPAEIDEREAHENVPAETCNRNIARFRGNV
jgi:hypothetical protein